MSPVELREYNRRWRAANPEKCTAYTKKYRAKNPDKTKDRIDKWKEKNKEKIIEYSRAWRRNNREKSKEITKRWRAKHPEVQRQASKRWAAKNRPKVNANYRLRCATDPCFRLGKILRARINRAVRVQLAKKTARTMDLTGCTAEFLIGYLSARFSLGMSWENYGRVWEIDHIFPCSLYDLTDEAQQRACFNYTNLQPLLVTENRKKYNKVLPCHSH